MKIYVSIIICCTLLSWCSSHQKGCRGMIPSMVEKPHNRNDVDKYVLHISGKPRKFVPYEHYNITLQLNPIYENTQHRFKHFLVAIEPYYDKDNQMHSSPGKLMIGYDGLSRFSESCENTLVESNTLPKIRVNFGWLAPARGCVVIRASVVESKDNWYADTEDLRRTLCEDSEESEDVKPAVLSHCCACDEAKYEMAFEGKWTRNTHPKDFPADPFDTHFSDVVGSSHKYGNSFWRVGDRASVGLAQLAVNSSTTGLEYELNRQNIRTIIKARGLRAPNPTDTTYALFRVDRENHLVSLVSRFAPSPDWFVGVYDLELCRPNCTWEESKSLNLYPFDAGVMDGISYESPKMPLTDQELIKAIKSNSPNDVRSPFYDESGASIKPIARLIVTRQKLYERECSGEMPIVTEDENCETTEWSEWSECSKTCGVGFKFRTRKLVNPEKARECLHVIKTEQDSCHIRTCYGANEYGQSSREAEEQTGDAEDFEKSQDTETDDSENCATTEWNLWSECSVVCGHGHRVRDRDLVNSQYKDQCPHTELEETEECDSSDCRSYEKPATLCKDSEWLEWDACNATCDTSSESHQGRSEGYRSRYAKPVEDPTPDNDDDDERNECPYKETVKCSISCTGGGPFNGIFSGNHIVEAPVGDVIDCRTTPWSSWSDCEITGSAGCGDGWRTKKRTILIHPENGGRPCPKRLFRGERCSIPCEGEGSHQEEIAEEEKELEEVTTREGCVMGPWSRWSPCTKNCGSAIQIRTRAIIRYGPDCPSRFEKKACQLPIGCDPYGNPNFH